ncbi:MAG: rhomboid family intramembrane serine protease [Pyrinomonadaceae bacterium]
MFPLGDDNSNISITPVVNILLIAANVLVFVFFQQFGGDNQFTYAYSTVPAEIVSGKDLVTPERYLRDPLTGARYSAPGLQPTLIPVYLTLLTSMFMHGGLAHLFGNMLFLWIFGDNVENRLGHFRYLIFYLVCGVLASLAHVFSTVMFNGNPYIPSLGASGAISGVLGAYLLLFPRQRVSVLLFYFITDVPAVVAIGLWFVFQLISGAGMLGSGSQGGGVAYAAHIGGFIAGLLLVGLFAIGRPKYTARRTRPSGRSDWGN